MSEEFTKIATGLMLNVRDLVNWGIEGGHTTPEKIRLSVSARTETAVKLIEAGCSQRQAAKLLGVGEATIRRDMMRQNGAENAPERRTDPSAEKATKRAEREKQLAQKQTALPRKLYGVIYADPEWKFKTFSEKGKDLTSAENHYPTSALEAIKARDVPSISADDSALFLWATVPMLPHALEVMRAWGFNYKTNWVWVKDRSGTGYWSLNKHELLLLGTRGSVPAPTQGTQGVSVIEAPRREHSRKPDEAYELIERFFPNLPKIELNQRNARPGWDGWGYEAPNEAAA